MTGPSEDEQKMAEGVAEPNQDRCLERRATSPGVLGLRLIALAGTLLVLLWQAASLAQIEPRQGYGFLVLVIAGLAVSAALLTLLPNATRCLFRHKDLLLPLGLLIFLEGLLNALVTIPMMAAVLTPAWSAKLLSLSLPVSLVFVIRVLLRVIYAGWTTKLVIQAVNQDRVEAIVALQNIGKWFWQVLILESIGWGVLFAMLMVAIALGTASLAFASVLIGILSLVWNLATAALLPFALQEGRSLGDGLREGISFSWRNMRRWWQPLITQMVLLGWVTFIYASYSTIQPTSANKRTVTEHTRTNWSVNAFWTGGYENECRWHTKLMEAVEAEPLQLISSLLGILFAILAIAIKLKIAGELRNSISATSDSNLYPRMTSLEETAIHTEPNVRGTTVSK